MSRVDIFDLDEAVTVGCVDDYIPGLRKVASTPVAGLWENSVLVKHASGWQANALVADLFGLTLAWNKSGGMWNFRSSAINLEVSG